MPEDFYIRGIEEMVAMIQLVRDSLDEQVIAALTLETLDDVDRCQAITPVESGRLRDGIHMEGPEVQGEFVTTAITTSHDSDAYSIRQHEDTSLKHETGGPKFIEKIVLESLSTMDGRLARHISIEKI